MDLKLKSKIALITGASKGIGAGIAHSLASEGAELYLTARNVKQLESLKLELQKCKYGKLGSINCLRVMFSFE